MRIVVAGLTVMLLSACGASQTGQASSNQRLVTQDEARVEIEKPESMEMSVDAKSENNPVVDGIEDLKLEKADSDTLAETTSDNPMIKEVGIQTEVRDTGEQAPMEAMEGEEKEIANQKDTEDKQPMDPKS